MPEITTKATIQDVGVRDHKRIADIYGYHVPNGLASFEESPPDAAEISRRLDVVRALDMPYIVAELDSDIVGYAFCSSYRPRPAYRFTVENTVYVDHHFPRRGLGYLLLEFLIKRIEFTPVRQMIAVIRDSDQVASIKLDESHAFCMVGTLEGAGFKFGRWVNTVIMRKPRNGISPA